MQGTEGCNCTNHLNQHVAAKIAAWYTRNYDKW